MNIDKKRLRELATMATPGEWKLIWRRGFRIIIEREEDDEWVSDLIARISAREETAAFIAAANPQAVLALLDENSTLRQENDQLKQVNALKEGALAAIDLYREKLRVAVEAMEMGAFHHTACPWHSGGTCCCAKQKIDAFLAQIEGVK